MSKNNNTCAYKKTSIGGQALMEGIMMRGPKVTAMAVRNTAGEIIIEKEPTQSATAPKFFKLPIVRGVYSFIYSMKTGSKYLMRSAELSGLEELEEEMEREKQEKKAAKKAAKAAKNGIVDSEPQASEKPEETSEKPEETSEKPEETSEKPEEVTETVIENIDQNTVNESGSDSEVIDEVIDMTENNTDKSSNTADKKEKNGGSVLTGFVMTVGMVLGIALAVGLFIILPSYIFKLVDMIPAINNADPILHSLYKSLFEGIIRIILLVGYMAAVSLMKDIRRTFMYHGAEHKTIFCYEAGLELTVENVRKQRRFHPRCGTSFLILMVLVSVVVSFFIDPVYMLITGNEEMHILLRVVLKLLMIPLIMGIGYELIRIAGRHDNFITRIISLPGVLLQRITVFEPTDDMIECAIAAVKEVIPDDDSDKW